MRLKYDPVSEPPACPLLSNERTMFVYTKEERENPARFTGPGFVPGEREFFIDNLLVRIHFIIVMICWTGLASWEFEFPFPGSLIFTGPEFVPGLQS